MKGIKYFLLFFSLITGFPFEKMNVLIRANAHEIFEEGSHCVAYKTKKKIFFLHRVNVVGRNCQISSQVIPLVGGKMAFELQIPAQSFESGEPERDQDVSRLLKADQYSAITFKTQGRSSTEWEELLSKKNFELAGDLVIAGISYPVVSQVQLEKNKLGVVAQGVLIKKFSDLGIEPPKIGLGLFAAVDNNVELYFQIRGDRTLGFDSLNCCQIESNR